MYSGAVEAFVEQRVANLAAISQRRNDLLREMHQLIHRRNNLGLVLGYEDEDEEGLNIFLQRFKVTENDTQTGSILNLSDHETLPNISPHPQLALSSKQTRSHLLQAAAPTMQLYSSPSLLPQLNAMPLTLDRSSNSIVTDPPSTSMLQQETDHGDDELDLLRKSPRLPIEPQRPPRGYHRTVTLAPDSVNTFKLSTEETATGASSEAKEKIATTGSLPSTFSLASKILLMTSVDSQESVLRRHDVTSPHILVDRVKLDDAENSKGLAVFPITRQAFLPAIPPPAKKPIVVSTTHPAAVPEPGYAFPDSSLPQPTPPISKEPPQRLHQFQPEFTLPSLKSINPDFKKSKSLKRKREREREAGIKESRKDDWAPMGLNKWAAIVNANPVWKKVARSTKCLTTREWAIAMSELRLIRAVDRIELLKREGRWSFRQPKKQRNIGGVLKTHWDHLMDEMKWMRVDFREERKWKLALAYNISTAVLDWHAAATMEVRFAKGLCVRWKPPCTERADHDMTVGEDPDLDRSAESAKMDIDAEENHEMETSLLGVDYGSEDEDEDEDGDGNDDNNDNNDDDDDDDDEDRDSRDIVDALEPSILIADALEEADKMNESRPNGTQDLQPKTEDVEDLSALIKPDESNRDTVTNMDVDDVKPDAMSGLKTTSSDPLLTSQPTPSSNGGDTDTLSSTSLKPGKSKVYAPFREIIAYSEDDKLFLDLEQFDMNKLDTSTVNAKEMQLPPPGLEAIFPDLHILDFDFTPIVQNVDGKKRPERKVDRDDPTKRQDDMLHTKLYPSGDYMMSKATLVGPLCPSKNWKNGLWSTLDDSAVLAESDVAVKVEDGTSDLFDIRSSNGPSMTAIQWQAAYMKDKDTRKRSDHLWNTVDDILLKSLCDRYPYNWALISECFNASRLTISTDKRSARDCSDRWKEKWCPPEPRRPQETASVAEATPPPSSSQMTTRGVKRLASASVSGGLPGGSLPDGSEPRKKRRHALVLDTIRKAGKKRADALQKLQSAQRKAPGVHETHAQYSKLPKRTPAELSRAKAEKEALQLQEIQQARKRQEEARNRISNGQGPQVAPQQAQQAPQPQTQQTTSAVQRAVGIPSQTVPQIRNQVNISQQQRTNTPIMQANRLTQQQLLQAQVRAVQAQQQHLAHAQTQIQSNGVNAANGPLPAGNTHLSQSYVTRDVTLSVSPPHNSAVASAVNSPRPPSAQAQVHPIPMQVPGNPGTRGTYYLPNIPNVQGYTTEQLQSALRLTQHPQQQAQQGFPNQS